jgi:hypothetical protein
MSRTRIIVISLFSLGVIAVAGLTIHYGGYTRKNYGYEFGYFGEINRINDSLNTIPGVTVNRTWGNYDVVVEEFFCEISLDSQMPFRLDFLEGDAIRSMRGDTLRKELLRRIDLSQAAANR